MLVGLKLKAVVRYITQPNLFKYAVQEDENEAGEGRSRSINRRIEWKFVRSISVLQFGFGYGIGSFFHLMWCLMIFARDHARSQARLLLLLLTWLLSPPTLAEPLQEPQLVIQSISDQLRQVMDRDQNRFETDPSYVFRLANDILVPNIDFDRVSSLALGKYWRKASQAQRSAFAAEFKKLLVRTYSTAFYEFMNWDIRYSPLRLSPTMDDASVSTKVLRPDAPPVTVIYRMHRRSGHWMAYDVKIEGVSLVTNYRSRFSREVRQGGMDGLVDLLTRLNNQRSASKNRS